MRSILLATTLLFILSGCQSGENTEDTADDTEPDTEEAAEQTSGESTDEESSEDSMEEGARSETEDSEMLSDESDESGDTMGEQNATSFDIHSDEVQAVLFDSDGVETENLTFSQDVITEGMSQSAVEEQYGTHNLVYPGHGGPVAIYGNLGVNYSDPGPFMNDDGQTEEETNPDENTVTNVMFYAGLPYDEVVDALGQPDVDVYETEGGPVSGQQLMEYEIEERDNSTVTGTFWLHDNESGEKIVDVMTMDEVPDDAEQVTAPELQETEGSNEEEQRINQFIEGYINELMAYYNDNEDDIMTYTRETSPNFEKISSNKASGNYRNHETHGINVDDISQSEDNVYEVTTSREYTHATSNGSRLTKVEYTIVETPQGFMVFDYQELNDEPDE